MFGYDSSGPLNQTHSLTATADVQNPLGKCLLTLGNRADIKEHCQNESSSLLARFLQYELFGSIAKPRFTVARAAA